jgi:hypothetical protein
MPISKKIETACFHMNALADIIFPGEPISTRQYEEVLNIIDQLPSNKSQDNFRKKLNGLSIYLPDSNKLP